MGDYIGDIIDRYASTNTSKTSGTSSDGYTSWRDQKKTSGAELSFTDMLGLMVAQFQNQTIDNQADTNDMMNQLIQMSLMQGMTKMTTQMEDLTQANILSYSASLVGKYVTVGVRDEEGNMQEIYDQVTATGTYDGNPVIFLGDKSYLLSSIMAVGKLPEVKKPENTENPGETTGTPDKDTESAEDTDGKVNKAEETEGA